jgi:uncharacterized membrane protein YcaP (DUF421 family)
MDTIIRACFVYGFLLLIFRISGKRTLAQVTTFDLVLTLIISETVQGALTDEDHSLTNGFLLVITLVGLNVLIAWVKQKSPRAEHLLEGAPVILIEKGHLRQDRMDEERVDEADILEEARELQGLARLDEIEYAVVEKNGQITVVPKQQPAA